MSTFKVALKATTSWARDRLQVRWHLLCHDANRKMENWTARAARWLPVRLRRAVIMDAGVRATQPSVIGKDAYAGPDGLELKTLWEHAGTPYG